MTFSDSIKVSLTMPLAWMADGFSGATMRLRAALDRRPATDARELSIPLVEAVTWLDILQPRLGGAFKSGEARGLLFLRARSHHHYAAAVYFDIQSGYWRWQHVDVLPEPQRQAYTDDERGEALYQRHLNPRGARNYKRRLARKPVHETFDKIEGELARLYPDYTFSTARASSAPTS